MSDAVADQDVTKALAFEREKNAVLLEQVVQLEDELVNRSMTEYAEVISEESREFWKQQLVSNREGAVRVLNEMRSARLALGDRGNAGGEAGAAGSAGNRWKAVQSPLRR